MIRDDQHLQSVHVLSKLGSLSSYMKQRNQKGHTSSKLLKKCKFNKCKLVSITKHRIVFAEKSNNPKTVGATCQLTRGLSWETNHVLFYN